VATTVIACVSYEVARFICLLDRPTLGIQRGSASEAKSHVAGFYLGAYAPTRRLIGLKDGSVIHVPDAWVEHAWKPEVTFLLQDRQVATSGYYLYIPIHADGTIGSKTAWPFKFALRLDQKAWEVSRHPGMGYEATLGFAVFLDTLPNAIKFTVMQKKNESDSWDDAIPVESIEFRRAF
jgi:hypothetical protein